MILKEPLNIYVLEFQMLAHNNRFNKRFNNKLLNMEVNKEIKMLNSNNK